MKTGTVWRIFPQIALTILICTALTGPAHGDASAATNPAQATAASRLIDAAARGDLGQVSAAIDQGANVNAVDEYNRTPLTASAGGEGPEARRLAIAKMLIAAGAGVDQHALFQPTPLLVAIRRRQSLIANYLLASGADPQAFDAAGGTALMAAAQTGQLEIVLALIGKGADIDAQDHSGRTALMYADGASSTDIAPPAAAAPPSPDPPPTGNRFTTIRYAQESDADLPGGADIVHALLAAGANIEAVDLTGDTALMIAARAGRTGVARALISANANWRHRDDISDNALMCALKGGHQDTIAYLKTVCGPPDPVTAALEKRLDGQQKVTGDEVSAMIASPAAGPQSDLPGVTMTVWAAGPTLAPDTPPTLFIEVRNDSPAPISILTPAQDAHETAAAEIACSVCSLTPGAPASPAPPDLPIDSPAPLDPPGFDPIAAVRIVAIPAEGVVRLPLDLGGDLLQATSSPGVYRAAFYLVSNPLPLRAVSTKGADIAASAMSCRLVSNELTIVNE